MDRQRAGFNLEDETIDLEELTSIKSKGNLTKEQIKKVDIEAEKLGFISRQPKKRRKKSPYTAQFGGKCREGMKELFQDIAERMDLYDTKTLELAILALIEKQGFEDLMEQYKNLVK